MLCYWRYDGWGNYISAISEQVGNLYSIIEKFNGDKSNYYPRIAAALSEYLKGNDEIGIRIIKHLINSDNSTLERKSKIWYFISCLAFVLFINLIGIISNIAFLIFIDRSCVYESVRFSESDLCPYYLNRTVLVTSFIGKVGGTIAFFVM